MDDIFNALREKSLLTKNFISSKVDIEGEFKTLTYKQN